MKTTKEYISLIASHAEELKTLFGVKSLRIFGSVSRNEQNDGSDIDVCVDMEPKIYMMVRLKRFLEDLLQCSVDVVRIHKHMNPFLLEELNRIRGLFNQIRQAILHLKEWNQDILSSDDYYCSPEGMKVLAASCMLIEAIGESVRQIDKISQSKLLCERPEIPWQDVIGIRNHIAHGYFDIDGDMVLDVVKNDLDDLLTAVEYFVDKFQVEDQ